MFDIKQTPMRSRSLLAFTALALSLLLIFIACRKNDLPAKASDKFDVAAAKEWYYGTFKKSAAYSVHTINDKGKKLPSWSRGKYKKIGDLEIVEFPLVRENTSVFLTTLYQMSKI